MSDKNLTYYFSILISTLAWRRQTAAETLDKMTSKPQTEEQMLAS